MNFKTTSLILFALVLLAVIPYGWFADQFPLMNEIFGMLFGSEFAHVVGHIAIFFTIGTVALLLWPQLLRRPSVYFSLILPIAILQEGFQLLYKERGVILNDITDIGTDLVAAGLAFALMRLAQQAKRNQQPAGRSTFSR